jgi:hypothetical protein
MKKKTYRVTPKTTNSNSLLPNTASNDIQQHVNSANSGDVDIHNPTVTLIRTVVKCLKSDLLITKCFKSNMLITTYKSMISLLICIKGIKL